MTTMIASPDDLDAAGVAAIAAAFSCLQDDLLAAAWAHPADDPASWRGQPAGADLRVKPDGPDAWPALPDRSPSAWPAAGREEIRRAQPSIRAVRHAVARRPVRRSELVEIDLGEANAVLRQLSQAVGPLRGHKFAVGIRRTGELAVAGAAVCAMPAAGPLQDGLTVELHRIAVATVAPANTMERLLAGIADLAARHGYRRLVTHGAAGAGAEALDATGWCVLPQRLASTIDGRPDADDHGG